MNELTELYNYHLPENLIAQNPLEDRTASRLLVLNKNTGEIDHKRFKDIEDYVQPGDLWIFNDTRVFPARIFLSKDTGTKIELLFLEQSDVSLIRWKALARPGKRLAVGTALFFQDTQEQFCRVISKLDDGIVEVELEEYINLFDVLEQRGSMPLPPYIKAPLADRERYQTVFSREKGSSAAPTAGLHFTGEIISKLKETAGVEFVTLRIGIDTFKPIKAETLGAHIMHTEFACVTAETAEAIAAAKGRGGRIVAVGTTVVRALESWALRDHENGEAGFRTNLFIRPGHDFKIVGALLTNFHLPKSTLLVLVSAFAGRDNILAAYNEAANLEYRFYSFGDAMLII